MDADVDMKDVAIREDAHCVFNVNSYQMVFVANSESFLYKRHAFTRAKQVGIRPIENKLYELLVEQCRDYNIEYLVYPFTVPSSGDSAHEAAFPRSRSSVGCCQRVGTGRGQLQRLAARSR